MKPMMFLLAFLSTVTAMADTVVIRNPLFQGSPIKAGVTGEPSFIYNSRAHMACRLAGYARAKMHDHAPVTRRKVVSRDGIRVFDPTSLFATDRTAREWWSVTDMPTDYQLGIELPTNLKASFKPKFDTIRTAHKCAKMAACMGYEVSDMFDDRLTRLNPSHPFVRQCMGWGTRSNEPFVFSEITCETNPRMEWQPGMAQRMAEFHHRTNDAYRVRGGSSHEAGLGIQDVSLCQGNTGYSASNLRPPQPGTCDYVPEYKGDWLLNLMGGDSLELYLALSNRMRIGPRVGPQCARDILTTYTQAVIPDEYGLSKGLLNNMQQPFCVESISPITTDAAEETCSFKVKTRDFLQRTTTIEVSLGTEGGTNHEAICEDRARCFADTTLSCAFANFCPAPGMIQRSKP